MEATRPASALPWLNTSTRCEGVPAPPEAITGTSTASAIKPLPAGDYTLVVVLHLNRDGEQRILAAAPPVALTVT